MVAASVTVLLVAAFGVNVVLSVVLPADLPLPVLQFLIAAGTVAVALPMTAWLGRRLTPARSLDGRGLQMDRERRRELALGVGVGLVGGASPPAIGVAVGIFDPVAWLDAGDLGLTAGIALILVAMMFVAGWEELLLRGVLVGELVTAFRRRLPPVSAGAVAVLSGAVVFGLGHAGQPGHPALLVTWVVAGIVLGTVYLVDGHLALVIGAHAGFNLAHNAVVIRSGVEGTDRLSALVRVEQTSDHWWLAPGGVVELTGFLLIGAAALLVLRRRRGLSS